MLIPFGVFSAGAGVSNSFELISTTLISTNTASVTFDVSSLASSYKHLQLRATARTDRANETDYIKMRFNGDSGANYTSHYLTGNGTSVTSVAGTAQNQMNLVEFAGSSGTTGNYGSNVTDILDAFSSAKNKVIRQLGGGYSAPYANIYLRSNAWLNTAAVTSISLTPGGGTNFVSGTRLSLYGIKG